MAVGLAVTAGIAILPAAAPPPPLRCTRRIVAPPHAARALPVLTPTLPPPRSAGIATTVDLDAVVVGRVPRTQRHHQLVLLNSQLPLTCRKRVSGRRRASSTFCVGRTRSPASALHHVRRTPVTNFSLFHHGLSTPRRSVPWTSTLSQPEIVARASCAIWPARLVSRREVSTTPPDGTTILAATTLP